MADLLVSVPDFQRASTQRLSPSILAYYNSGAGTQLTLGENCSAFNKYNIAIFTIGTINAIYVYINILSIYFMNLNQ